MTDPVDVEVSVISASPTNRDLLRDCLRSLDAACVGLAFHLTVVDNAADDLTAAMVRDAFPGAALVQNTRPLGFGANHNQVIRRIVAEGSARYVLILNDDTVLDSECVTELVRLCDADDSIGFAGPLLRRSDGTRDHATFRFPSIAGELVSAAVAPERLRARLWRATVGVEPSECRPQDVDWLLGAVLLARVAALETGGDFDERFFLYSEEVDLAYRGRREGWRSVYCPSARAWHLGGSSTRSPSFSRMTGRSRWRYVAKHWSRPRIAALVVGLAAVYLWNTAYITFRIAFAPGSARAKVALWKAHWRARPLPDFARPGVDL